MLIIKNVWLLEVTSYLTFCVGFHLSEGSSPLCGSSTGGCRMEIHTSPFCESTKRFINQRIVMLSWGKTSIWVNPSPPHHCCEYSNQSETCKREIRRKTACQDWRTVSAERRKTCPDFEMSLCMQCISNLRKHTGALGRWYDYKLKSDLNIVVGYFL